MTNTIWDNFKKALKEHFLKLLMLAAIFGFIAFIVAVLQPREYSSGGRLLIVPKGSVELDAYTASRAGERLGNTLKELVYSNSFLDLVIGSSGGQVTDDYGSKINQEKRLKRWKKRVDVDVLETSGALSVAVYHVRRLQAEATAKAVFYLLKTQGPAFYGGKGVEIQEIESPITSTKPVRPNLAVAAAAGAATGFAVGAGLLFIMAPEMRSRREELMFDPHRRA